MTTRKKVPWSHWDRLLFIIIGAIFALVVGLSIWFHELDKNPVVTIPTPTPPAVNAFDYYNAAGNAVVDAGKISWAIMSKLPPGQKPAGDMHIYTLAQKAVLVRENAGAIQTLHLGFHYPYQEPPIRSFTTGLPHLASERGLARLLFLQAQVKAEQGDWNGVVSSDLDAIQLGEEIPHGGALLPLLVGVACQAIGRRHAWEAVNHLNTMQARAAVSRLEKIRADHVPFAATLQEEKWGGQAGLLELMEHRGWPGNLISLSSPDGDDSNVWQNRLTLVRVRLTGKRAIIANYTHYMNQSIANARQPFAAHLAPPPLPTDPANQILLPVFQQARMREVEADTQNALLLTMMALHAYQLDHRAYPATLSALAPNYLKAVPNDPFAQSGPLHYKQVGRNYLLYSVGPDGIDDGGKPIFNKSMPAPSGSGGFDRRYWVQQTSQGDIVAGVNTN